VTTVSGVRSIFGDNLVTCVIDSFILARPAGSEVAAVQVDNSSAEVSQVTSVAEPSASDSATQEATAPEETAVEEPMVTATANTSEYGSTASFDEPAATISTTQDQVEETEIEQIPTETVDDQIPAETTSVDQSAADDAPVDQSISDQPVADPTSVEQYSTEVPVQSDVPETPVPELTVDTTLAEQPTASHIDQPAPIETFMGEVGTFSDGITTSEAWTATQIVAIPETTVPGRRRKPSHKQSKPNGQKQQQQAQNWWSWFLGWN
jgi:hypothetical protein